MSHLNRRIVVTPPQSFLDTSELSNPPAGQLDNPVVFGQDGQAAIIGNQAALGQLGQQSQPGAADAAAQQASPDEPVVANDSPSPPLVQSGPTHPSELPILESPSSPVSSTSTSPITSSVTSLATTSLASESLLSSSLIPSEPSLSSASWTSPALPSATSSTATSAHHRAFTQTPLFVVIMVLSSLVFLAVLATLFSAVCRRSCCFLCSRRKDDDGLSDVLYSFHSHSRSNSSSQMGSLSALGLSGPSTIAPDRAASSAGIAGLGMGANGIDTLSEEDGGVQRRATMLAQHPEQSAFLHSGQGGFPVLHDISDVRDERRIHSPQPGTYGEMWEVPITPDVGEQEGHEVESVTDMAVERALEIRNWSPGDSDGRSSILTWANQAAGGAAPRDLGNMSAISERNSGTRLAEDRSERDSLSRSSSTRHGIPYLAAPDPRDYVPSSFNSPADTVVDLQPTISDKTEAEPPSRAGTWASNLRDTLFAAIQGVRPVTEDIEGDGYTRSPTPPSQSRRSVHRFLSRSSAGSGGEDAEAIPGYFLTPSLSNSITSSRPAVGAGSRTAPVEYVSKLEANGAGERYKRSYGRNQRATNA